MSFCGWYGTEKYKDHFESGKYVCAKCKNDLFASESKYKHSSPWPAFTQTIHADSLLKIPETATAIKVLCGKCKNPLGHEFIGDGPKRGSRF